jgi:hypothetical protein
MITAQTVLEIITDQRKRGATSDLMNDLFLKLRNGQDFSPDVSQKIAAIITGGEIEGKKLSQEVKDLVLTMQGEFHNRDIAQTLRLTDRTHLKNLSTILARLQAEGIIEKSGSKYGNYRLVDQSFTEMKWWEQSGKGAYEYFLPLSIHTYARLYEKNIILVEGVKSQGKTALSLEFARQNATLMGEKKKARFMSSEAGEQEMYERIKMYPEDLIKHEWWRTHVEFIERNDTWWDIILADGVNVIDYVDDKEDATRIPSYITKIYQKLRKGICLVCIQKDPYKPFGYGGSGTREKPRIVLTLQGGYVTMSEVKSPCIENTGGISPTGWRRRYHIVDGWKFVPTKNAEWEQEYDKPDYSKRR